MPDIGISDNVSNVKAQLAQAVSDAASAKTMAASARTTATAAETGVATAATSASSAQTAADAAQTSASSALAQIAAGANRIQKVVLTTPNLTLVASTADLTVTWPVPFADGNYFVDAVVWVTGLTVGKIVAQPKYGSISPTGCIVTVASLGVAIAAGQTVDVIAIHP